MSNMETRQVESGIETDPQKLFEQRMDQLYGELEAFGTPDGDITQQLLTDSYGSDKDADDELLRTKSGILNRPKIEPFDGLVLGNLDYALKEARNRISQEQIAKEIMRLQDIAKEKGLTFILEQLSQRLAAIFAPPGTIPSNPGRSSLS